MKYHSQYDMILIIILLYYIQPMYVHGYCLAFAISHMHHVVNSVITLIPKINRWNCRANVYHTMQWNGQAFSLMPHEDLFSLPFRKAVAKFVAHNHIGGLTELGMPS